MGSCRKSIYIRPFVVLLGYQLPEWIQGQSLVPSLQGAQNPVRSVVFGEVTFHAAYEPQRSIRTERWLYIRRFGDRTKPVLPNIDQSPALDWLMEHKWHNRRLPSIQLYDNAIDPNQDVNIAGRPLPEALSKRSKIALWPGCERLATPSWMAQFHCRPVRGLILASDRNPDGPLVTENYQIKRNGESADGGSEQRILRAIAKFTSSCSYMSASVRIVAYVQRSSFVAVRCRSPVLSSKLSSTSPICIATNVWYDARQSTTSAKNRGCNQCVPDVMAVRRALDSHSINRWRSCNWFVGTILTSTKRQGASDYSNNI